MLAIQLSSQLHNTVYKMKKVDLRETVSTFLGKQGLKVQEAAAVNGVFNGTMRSEIVKPADYWA
ncbi:hypothetical protein [Paenibacillus sp. CF384]|uniref:hypothetical protein n=1 Tax=Paenibacillus sp. CF384 TaxID=1884382 RepID=UPI0008957FD7|nr:hypothetical protein [Paenibacillus sp. CF384]SDW68668.1 hypothetical protein SAMN05518855_1004142 [Paenibacillus sp. CF384]